MEVLSATFQVIRIGCFSYRRQYMECIRQKSCYNNDNNNVGYKKLKIK